MDLFRFDSCIHSNHWMKTLQGRNKESLRCWPLTLLTPYDWWPLWPVGPQYHTTIRYKSSALHTLSPYNTTLCTDTQFTYTQFTQEQLPYTIIASFVHNSHPVQLKISWQILWGCHFRVVPKICVMMSQMGQNHEVVDSYVSWKLLELTISFRK